MTQLIGAVCENGKKILLLSDRLVSRAGLAFERETKGQKIATNAMVLSAGTVHEPELIAQAKNDLSGISKPPILKIAKKLTEKYQEIRLCRISDEVLKAKGFNSIESYYDKQKILHDSVVFDINREIEKYDLGVHILLGGVDRRAHLYYIQNPGTYSSFDDIGFFCPGMGKEQAESTFVWYEFASSLSVNEALYIAFEAKKKAETAGDVGKTTDAWLVDKGGTYEIRRQTIEKLEEIYRVRQALPRFDEKITELRVP